MDLNTTDSENSKVQLHHVGDILTQDLLSYCFSRNLKVPHYYFDGKWSRHENLKSKFDLVGSCTVTTEIKYLIKDGRIEKEFDADLLIFNNDTTTPFIIAFDDNSYSRKTFIKNHITKRSKTSKWGLILKRDQATKIMGTAGAPIKGLSLIITIEQLAQLIPEKNLENIIFDLWPSRNNGAIELGLF